MGKALSFPSILLFLQIIHFSPVKIKRLNFSLSFFGCGKMYGKFYKMTILPSHFAVTCSPDKGKNSRDQ